MSRSSRILLAGIPWRFFLGAFVFSWLCWSPPLFHQFGLVPFDVPFVPFFLLGTWGPFVAALLSIRRDDGEGVGGFIRDGLRLRLPFRWLLRIVGVSLLVSAVPLSVHLLLGGIEPDLGILRHPWAIVPVFGAYFVTAGGNEEWGWRAYAQERMQRSMGPLAAAVVIGVFWGLWHLPLFFIPETGQSEMSLGMFLLAAPALSVLHAWIYNGAGGFLLPVWVFHAAVGTCWEVFPIVQPGLASYDQVQVAMFSGTIVVAVAVVVLVGPRLGQHAIQEPSPPSSI